ncbi:MAG: NADP-dependent malic enzyme [Gammaproteobacteria bacterium]
MKDELRDAALEYHRQAPAGKIAIRATKPLANQHDLSLAYSPGVAAACAEIVESPLKASELTARGNLVAVVTNGSAVLGLGPIGPLAAKPVMEGKGVLFKKFAGIDVFDLEINERDPDKLVDIIASLEPTFGGINLEDIKSPECFIVEEKLRERMSIPVFHDDQHGTAIIVAAGIINALRVVEKDLDKVKMVVSGAGAAALSCLGLLTRMGLPLENIFVTDIDGVIYKGRETMHSYQTVYARQTDARTLDEVIEDADVFLGLSAPGVLTREMVKKMAARPVIFALANPEPEIDPEEARAANPDAVIATGRSDFPNQVNNVLCFPYLFRGALDVGATTINLEMEMAAVHAIAELAMAEPSEIVARAYGGSDLRFGPDYLIPKPFDPRLIVRVAPAVARAAMDSGVATRPIEDMKVYRQKLLQFVFQTGTLMNPVFDEAKKDPRRVVYPEGEEKNILQAVQQVVDEGMARPILIGRPKVIEKRIRELGLRLEAGRDFECVNIHHDERYYEYWNLYHEILGRRGISPDEAKTVVRSQPTAIAALMVRRGEADAMLCGSVGPYISHLKHIDQIIDKKEGVSDLSAVTVMVLPSGTFFICDTHVTADPDSEEIVEMTLLAAETVRRFGMKPRAALLSHSNFGTRHNASTMKMRKAVNLLHEREPGLAVDGEMHADAALSDEIRNRVLPGSRLKGKANLFIMPNLDAANIAYNLLKMLGGGVSIGPMLIGTGAPVHIITSSVTVRGIVNMTALSVVEAQDREKAVTSDKSQVTSD